MSTPEERADVCAKKKHYEQKENAEAFARRVQAMHPGSVLRVVYRCDCGRYCIATPVGYDGKRTAKRLPPRASAAPSKKKGRGYKGNGR